MQTNAPRGQWVAISRTGGSGHVAVQYVPGAGLYHVAIDIDDAKLERKCRCYHQPNEDPVVEVSKRGYRRRHGCWSPVIQQLSAWRCGGTIARRSPLRSPDADLRCQGPVHRLPTCRHRAWTFRKSLISWRRPVKATIHPGKLTISNQILDQMPDWRGRIVLR